MYFVTDYAGTTLSMFDVDAVNRFVYYINDVNEIRRRSIDLSLNERQTEKVVDGRDTITGIYHSI